MCEQRRVTQLNMVIRSRIFESLTQGSCKIPGPSEVSSIAGIPRSSFLPSKTTLPNMAVYGGCVPGMLEQWHPKYLYARQGTSYISPCVSRHSRLFEQQDLPQQHQNHPTEHSNHSAQRPSQVYCNTNSQASSTQQQNAFHRSPPGDHRHRWPHLGGASTPRGPGSQARRRCPTKARRRSADPVPRLEYLHLPAPRLSIRHLRPPARGEVLQNQG
ncbi:hypothetical protein EJ03DRAFT_201750 [Teratosphaeria nubilosa]|uniref:Uncharacterized protein n=1 Tax=Teratosphaeria nubilosa TaxID=161662 RepID=A0A6G1LIC0_9PEZI|nr:hypothetical protein EJ03DRAFT_201750 [Teratosphaeria nubilosa]